MTVTVHSEKPTIYVDCKHCYSLLGYKSDDTKHVPEKQDGIAIYKSWYYIDCPVCRSKVQVTKKEKL